MASNQYSEPRTPAFPHEGLEENLEEVIREDYNSLLQIPKEEGEGDSGSVYQCNNNKTPFIPNLLEQDLFWEDEELSSLLAKEEQYPLEENHPSLPGSRLEAVEWILKVNGYYSFSCLTAVLAVNYFDRFLSSFHLHTDKPWMIQLAAVACLSLAAKVEETQVPLLLDLQVELEDSKYIFEAKTIQRMEILVLSTLQWRMNPVTPLSFIDYFTSRLRLKSHLCWEFTRRCERVLLSIIPDFRSTHYAPSVIATATMLIVINGVETCLGSEFQNQLLGILRTDNDKVEDCWKLLKESASREYDRNQLNKHKFSSVSDVPGSPNGVMDVSFSTDSSKESWAIRSASSSVSSSPEPLPKKGRARALQGLDNDRAPADFS